MDPILFAGGDTNLYGYVLNDPVNLFDPNGYRPFICRILEVLGEDISVDLEAGLGFGLGISGGLPFTRGGVSGKIVVGTGIGVGASAGVGRAFVLAEGNEGITFGTTVAVTGGAIAGGSANITAGTGGVTANVSGMIGVGFNIVSGFVFGGPILECPDEELSAECNTKTYINKATWIHSMA